ncbi:F-box/FBD/LRR-repeat protein At3g26920-like [Trifolium pratense]|uniref:Uncharacterized protein n=1 Tax=Trifolium pratense TaxID=57577 RepID=A0ACB0J6I4_TRIPR|nr:F-box/FBD/LRR-repeat protein At3g26920-like [Trifolium pratense]CAJ2639312.1 unnamed protein product [Trifolium pratense]
MTSSSRRPIPTIDRISDLPDSILGHILSFFPTKFAATTSVLSKRWNLVWLSVLALNFNDYESFQKCVSLILFKLRDEKTPIHSFTLKFRKSSSFNEKEFNRIFEFVMQLGIKYLDFKMSDKKFLIESPPAILRFKTLEVLKLANVIMGKFDKLDFPLLKTLHLDSVSFISLEYFVKLLFGCPILEDLHTKSSIYQFGQSYVPMENLNALPNLVKVRIINDMNTLMKILSLRGDASPSLHTLEFRRHEIMEPCLLKRIIKYAVSHNVQRLDTYITCDIQHFPTLFSCHTLTSLSLCVTHPKDDGMCTLVPKALDLPSLTDLKLRHCAFCVGDDGRVEPFSALTRLKSLIMVYCKVPDSHNLCISNTKLVNLNIYMCHYDPETYFGIKLSAPSLCNFNFRGILVQKHCGNNNDLSSIKHACIDLISLWNSKETSLVLLNWLIELANIETLTVSSTTLEVLSFVPDLLKAQLRFLCHLKSLKVEMRLLSSIPYGIVDLFLKQSPSLKVDIIN